MIIQEQVINAEQGQEYWNIFFQLQSKKSLTLLEWELINNQINKMIYDFENNK